MKYCEHNKKYYNCKFCYPKILCEHDKKKSSCNICSKQLVCDHNKRYYNCKICYPKGFCVHDKKNHHVKFVQNIYFVIIIKDVMNVIYVMIN